MMDIEMTSPIGPMIATGCEETRRLEFPGYATEVDLCNLLQSMTLSKRKTKDLEGPTTTQPSVPYASQGANGLDANTEDLGYLSDVSESSSSKCSSCDPHPTSDNSQTVTTIPTSRLPACHFLQSILASLAPESPVLSPSPYPYPVASTFQTMDGAYVDTILIHRSLQSAFPPGHRGCAVALQEIARALELRSWQAGRDSDADAVAALRQEAFLMTSYYG